MVVASVSTFPKGQSVSKKFLTDVILQSTEMTGVAAGQVAADLIAAIKAEIVETGRFSLPDFGTFTVRETPKRTALNPSTGEKVQVKVDHGTAVSTLEIDIEMPNQEGADAKRASEGPG